MGSPNFDEAAVSRAFRVSTRPGIILGLSDPFSGTARMAASGTNSRQSELGDFLRSRRQKLTPKAVGLPVGRRRRTPGLRREEVAELAGIGVDWYVRLAQGRSVRPSAGTIDALERALRLIIAENRNLPALQQNAYQR